MGLKWDTQKWDLPINPAKSNYLTIGRHIPLTLSFSADGFGTPIPVSKLVKDLGVQAIYSLPLLSALKLQIRQDD